MDRNGVFFLTRLKCNADIAIVKQFLTDQQQKHILSDEDIHMTGYNTAQKYSGTLPMVPVYDAENDEALMLFANQMPWRANPRAQLYHARWDVEASLVHLKQLFCVKTFVGALSNPVRIQMWCSMIAMLLVKSFKNKAQYQWHLSNLITLFTIHCRTLVRLVSFPFHLVCGFPSVEDRRMDPMFSLRLGHPRNFGFLQELKPFLSSPVSSFLGHIPHI